MHKKIPLIIGLFTLILAACAAPQRSAVAPMEAFACGTPVLGSPNGALPEFLDHGNNGFIVNNYNDAVQTVMKYRQQSHEKKLEMFHNAYNSVITSGDMACQYLKLYEKILTEKYLYSPDLVLKMGFNPKETVYISKAKSKIA